MARPFANYVNAPTDRDGRESEREGLPRSVGGDSSIGAGGLRCGGCRMPSISYNMSMRYGASVWANQHMCVGGSGAGLPVRVCKKSLAPRRLYGPNHLNGIKLIGTF